VTYTTLQQLTDRFGEATLIQLTDRGEVRTGEIDEFVLARALADADAVINGSLAKRYRLPLAAVPDLVADLALSIAIYKLHVFSPEPKIKDDYLEALRTLRQIATGDQVLDLAGLEPETSGAFGVVASDRPRDLTPANLSGFI
jgi:phage gp36-like protein